jgi:hypothetical protein
MAGCLLILSKRFQACLAKLLWMLPLNLAQLFYKILCAPTTFMKAGMKIRNIQTLLPGALG